MKSILTSLSLPISYIPYIRFPVLESQCIAHCFALNRQGDIHPVSK